MKAGAGRSAAPSTTPATAAGPRLRGAIPILLVRDVTAAARFYEGRLGFAVDFLHGQPPFYGSVSRDGACLHLRFVRAPGFAALAAVEEALIVATVETSDVKALFADVSARGAAIAQPLTRHPWGGLDFHVRDPDGNVVSFVEYRPGRVDAPPRL